ncbi:MAG: histidine triad nucleotide-binding protein [Akkermansia sp.]|nr:histidine triad nucleotide-binding protein [Akkermansia sp.]
MATLFEKICTGEIPADIVYQDEVCVCFRDINPGAPTHVLLVPRKAIPRLAMAQEDDAALLGHMLLTVGKVARLLGVDESGFRLVINNGPHAGETVPHLHMHILGGRDLEWPPG